MLKCPECEQTEKGFQAVVSYTMTLASDETPTTIPEPCEEGVTWIQCLKCCCTGEEGSTCEAHDVEDFFVEEVE